jgi:hypothetical protein
MTQDGEPVERYGWFAYNKDGSRSYFKGGSETPLPGHPASPGPVHIRMFVDDVSGIGLWRIGGIDPTDLPLSDELVVAVNEWVDEYTRSFQDPAFDEYAHDQQGFELSKQIQEHLGENYVIEFRPATREFARHMKDQF